MTSFTSTWSVEAASQSEASSIEVTNRVSIEEQYSDVATISTWALDGVQQATDYGFVQGSNGQFKPQSAITRAEFTKILAALLHLNINNGIPTAFNDVNPESWFYPYVMAAYQQELITGYNNNFNPAATITREEMAVILNRALSIKAESTSISLKDSSAISSWALPSVSNMITTGLMLGDQSGFRPKGTVTREMAALVAVRAYHYKQNLNVDIKQTIAEQLKATAIFLQQTITNPVIASVGGDWTVLALARANADVPSTYYSTYYNHVLSTMTDLKGKLHAVKYTEYDRVILALTSLGKSITDVAGYDLSEPLADYNTVIKQGINGPIFALIALDSNHYEIPIVEDVPVQTTRELLIDFIMKREIAGGGWALGSEPTQADPDITAMAIQALTPYYAINETVKAAVDRGIAWLSKAQRANGGFTSTGASNSESIAQVVIALTGIGIDPMEDARFVKNGTSMIDALLSFAAPNGGFYHVKLGGIDNGGARPGTVDHMATDQVFLALISYKRYLHGDRRLYDMSDVIKVME